MFEPAASNADTLPGRDIYTVSRLNREVRTLLESGLPLLWVEGEISNLARPRSGHFYFSLKDPAAQVRCAMFRTRNMNLDFSPEDGMQVVVRGRVGLYEPRGDYQFIVEHMEQAGAGALRQAFEALKQRLSAAGLFDPAHKKPLPAFPRRVGVITSPTGAAVRDIIHVLGRRFPALEVLVYPVPVQGEGAGQKIAEAIRLASERRDCDVLILARGGGSLEDLWAFNEEVVARAVYDCALPIISGVGHEIDFTIADFVADRRAPTPSAAAELVSPNRDEWLQTLRRLESRLAGTTLDRIKRKTETLGWLSTRLRQQHPGQRLQAQSQRLDELSLRLENARRTHFRHAQGQLREMTARLQRHAPLHRIQALESRRAALTQRLTAAHTLALERRRGRLKALARALDAVSPLAVLGRGYAIVRRLPDAVVLTNAAQVSVGDQVEAQLSHGRLICRVDETQRDDT